MGGLRFPVFSLFGCVFGDGASWMKIDGFVVVVGCCWLVLFAGCVKGFAVFLLMVSLYN